MILNRLKALFRPRPPSVHNTLWQNSFPIPMETLTFNQSHVGQIINNVKVLVLFNTLADASLAISYDIDNNGNVRSYNRTAVLDIPTGYVDAQSMVGPVAFRTNDGLGYVGGWIYHTNNIARSMIFSVNEGHISGLHNNVNSGSIILWEQ